jgi:hypothetical protein
MLTTNVWCTSGVWKLTWLLILPNVREFLGIGHRFFQEITLFPCHTVLKHPTQFSNTCNRPIPDMLHRVTTLASFLSVSVSLGGRSVGIVHSRTKGHGVCLFVVSVTPSSSCLSIGNAQKNHMEQDLYCRVGVPPMSTSVITVTH